MKLDVYKIDGSKSGESVELSDGIFNIEPNDHAIYLSVKAYLANQRQGTHKSKERSEVSGGGKKPWRQKGRGGARAGSSRSPLWVGGGTIFGPRPRDYRQSLNKKVNRLARKSALSYKAKGDQIIVIEDFTYDTPETKKIASLLKAFNLDGKKTLFLTGENNPVLYKSGRNIQKLSVLQAANASAYDLLNCQILVMQKTAVEAMQSTFNNNNEKVA